MLLPLEVVFFHVRCHICSNSCSRAGMRRAPLKLRSPCLEVGYLTVYKSSIYVSLATYRASEDRLCRPVEDAQLVHRDHTASALCMVKWCIGSVQGCYVPLQSLVRERSGWPLEDWLSKTAQHANSR